MHERSAVQGLSSAAAELCAAHDALAAAGYHGWSVELRALIDIIDAEIECLRGHGLTIRFAASE